MPLGRPRTISNEQIIGAAARAIGRVGPGALTLADVAGEVGLAPATLMQRFGSKRGLLLAVAAGGAEGVPARFAAAREQHDSPLETLLAALAAMTRPIATPEEASNHAAFLQIDLTDPDFHRLVLAHAESFRKEVRELLGDAVAAGELCECDTALLARTVQSTYNGALLTWAIYRRGSASRWLREELELVLDPYRAEAG